MFRWRKIILFIATINVFVALIAAGVLMPPETDTQEQLRADILNALHQDGTAALSTLLQLVKSHNINLLIGNYKENLYTTLWLAVHTQDPSTVQNIIKQGAKIDNKSHDNIDSGQTALMHAAQLGNIECLDLLLKAGADINYRNNEGKTALHFAAPHPDCVRFLIEHGAEALIIDAGGVSPCHAAAAAGTPESLNLLIEKSNNLLQAIDYTGNTALHYAALPAVCDTYWIAKGLLYHLQENNVADLFGPREPKSSKGHAECIKLLLNAGCDVNALGMENSATPLELAVISGNIQSVAALLDAGANTEYCVNPILACAICSGNPECLKYLLNRNIKPRNPSTLFRAAVFSGNMAMLEVLLNHGVKDTEGIALHTAIQCAHYDMVEYLVKKSVKFTIHRGMPPMERAMHVLHDPFTALHYYGDESRTSDDVREDTQRIIDRLQRYMPPGPQ